MSLSLVIALFQTLFGFAAAAAAATSGLSGVKEHIVERFSWSEGCLCHLAVGLEKRGIVVEPAMQEAGGAV